jgi:UDP-glucose 4-epimerase
MTRTEGIRVVVIGATGNVGAVLVRKLSADPAIGSLVAIARRRPDDLPLPKVTWQTADITTDDLTALVRGADCVVHLAWVIQPSHDLAVLRRVNVLGSERVFEAVGDAGVPSLVYASSNGTYAPGPRDRPVDETHPTTGVRSAFYARHKAEVERMLDAFEEAHPTVRVVRMRPALIFRRTAAVEVRRLFLGPFVPTFALRPSLVPIVPDVDGLIFQAVHCDDVAEAYRLAIVSDVRGAFNLTAEPILSPRTLADLLGARTVRIPAKVVRRLVDLTWRLRLQPTPPGWFDMGIQVPMITSRRAERELGWHPRRTAVEALEGLLAGLRERADDRTPPLAVETSAPSRHGDRTHV